MSENKKSQISSYINSYYYHLKSGNRDKVLKLRSKISSVANLEKPMFSLFDFLNNSVEIGLLKKININIPSLMDVFKCSNEIDLIMDRLLNHDKQDKDFNLILAGSAGVGNYFSVCNKSDIDIDVIFDKYSDNLAFGFSSVKTELKFFLDLYKTKKADMLMSKVYRKKRCISIHYIPRREFTKIVNFDYQFSDQKLILRAYRTIDSTKPNGLYGPTHDFFGQNYYIPINTRQIEGGLISDQTFVYRGKNNQIVLGPSLHKLIFHSNIWGRNKDAIKKDISYILKQLKLRQLTEEKQYKRLALFRLLVAKQDKMPIRFINKIRRLDNKK